MLRFRGRFPAGLFLLFVLFTALPRTLFHHCEEGLSTNVTNEGSNAVHADAHCPICEAPIPLCDGVGDFTFHVRMVPLGAHLEADILAFPYAIEEAPRQRGPPNLG